MLRGGIELMADGVLVVLLLAFIWAAILVPPAAGARAAREADFLGSIRPGHDPSEGNLDHGRSPVDAVDQSRFRPGLTAKSRKRQVLGGLVVAMGATLVLGLLPTFRLLLVVHLFLVNSCLAYVGLLVHLRDSQAGAAGRGVRTGTREQPLVAAVPHPYGPASEDGYEDELASYEAGYGDAQRSFADAYASAADDGYADDRYDGYEIDPDDEAEAAFVDELALPA